MSDGSFDGPREDQFVPNAPRQRRVLHALEQYLIDAQKAAEAEVKRNPLEYAGGLAFSAIVAVFAEQYGLSHTLSALTAVAGIAAAGASTVVIRRHLHNRKNGGELSLLSQREAALVRKLALGFARALRDLGRKFGNPALATFAAALIFVVNIALPARDVTVSLPHRQGTEWVAPPAATPAPPEKFANLRWTVAYNPPVYSRPMKTVVTVVVNSLHPWPVNDNA
jgi:hypothetical protein